MENQEQNKMLISQIEALLFIYGEPMDVKKLGKIIGVKDADLKAGIMELEKELLREERGLILIQDKDKIQLTTKPQFAKLLEEITKQEFNEALTPAALETLSIIAYAGPITRADVEYIRGVNSSFIIRSLVLRGLIEREVDPKRANAYIYSASFDLLRYLGLGKNQDLPEYEKYKGLVAHLRQELEQKDKKEAQKDIIGDSLDPSVAENISAQPSAMPAENQNQEDGKQSQ